MKEIKGFAAMLTLTDLPDDVILDACPPTVTAPLSPRRRPLRRALLLCAAVILGITLLTVVMVGQLIRQDPRNFDNPISPGQDGGQPTEDLPVGNGKDTFEDQPSDGDAPSGNETEANVEGPGGNFEDEAPGSKPETEKDAAGLETNDKWGIGAETTEIVKETETDIAWETETNIAWETETETSDYPDMAEDSFLVAGISDYGHIDSFIQPEPMESSTYQGALAFCERKVPAIIHHSHCEEPVLSISYMKLHLYLPEGAEVQHLIVYNAAGEVCTPDMPDSYYVSIMVKRGGTDVYDCYVFRLKITENVGRFLYTIYQGDDLSSGREFEYVAPATPTETSTGSGYDEKESIDETIPDVEA